MPLGMLDIHTIDEYHQSVYRVEVPLLMGVFAKRTKENVKMRKNKNSCDLSDLYFIFADNVYLKLLTYEKFKALINFYALLYDRILIPDAFLINNHYLMQFLTSDGGMQYIEEGIIVPSVRKGTVSLIDTYRDFERNGTLIQQMDGSKEAYSYLEQISLSKAIKWDINTIGDNFTNNIFDNMGSLELYEEDKKRWEEQLYALKSDNHLTRNQLHKLANSISFLDGSSHQKINSYVDISYNFNIPNSLKTSAAYPDILHTNLKGNTSPQKIFFKTENNEQTMQAVVTEGINTSLFNEGILASLNAEQISIIRNLKGYKRFVQCIKKSSSEKHQRNLSDYFIEYIDEFEKELPRIININNLKQVDSYKSRLKIKTFITNHASNDIVGLGMGLIIESLAMFPVTKLIGSLINIMISSSTETTERELKRIERDGRTMLRNIGTDQSINDTLKSFSINSIK
jgi:hypothetical protein